MRKLRRIGSGTVKKSVTNSCTDYKVPEAWDYSFAASDIARGEILLTFIHSSTPNKSVYRRHDDYGFGITSPRTFLKNMVKIRITNVEIWFNLQQD